MKPHETLLVRREPQRKTETNGIVSQHSRPPCIRSPSYLPSQPPQAKNQHQMSNSNGKFKSTRQGVKRHPNCSYPPLGPDICSSSVRQQPILSLLFGGTKDKGTSSRKTRHDGMRASRGAAHVSIGSLVKLWLNKDRKRGRPGRPGTASRLPRSRSLRSR